MSVQNKTYITATELAEMLGISKGHAYKIIRGLNNELKKDGYIVFSGKVVQYSIMLSSFMTLPIILAERQAVWEESRQMKCDF